MGCANLWQMLGKYFKQCPKSITGREIVGTLSVAWMRNASKFILLHHGVADIYAVDGGLLCTIFPNLKNMLNIGNPLLNLWKAIARPSEGLIIRAKNMWKKGETLHWTDTLDIHFQPARAFPRDPELFPVP